MTKAELIDQMAKDAKISKVPSNKKNLGSNKNSSNKFARLFQELSPEASDRMLREAGEIVKADREYLSQRKKLKETSTPSKK